MWVLFVLACTERLKVYINIYVLREVLSSESFEACTLKYFQMFLKCATLNRHIQDWVTPLRRSSSVYRPNMVSPISIIGHSPCLPAQGMWLAWSHTTTYPAHLCVGAPLAGMSVYDWLVFNLFNFFAAYWSYLNVLRCFMMTLMTASVQRLFKVLLEFWLSETDNLTLTPTSHRDWPFVWRWENSRGLNFPL